MEYVPTLLKNEAAKKRLVTVEFPVIEQYNKDRDDIYKITVQTTSDGLALKYKLKPGHNVYELVTTLFAGYPLVPPET
ncbi:MAG: hypothetical protein ACO3F3_18665, partial [Gemmataceae bacterium]